MLKHKKKIYSNVSVVLAILVMLLGACGEEMNQWEVNNEAQRFVMVSQASNENIINIGGRIEFSDASRGVATREWGIPDKDSVTVLEGDEGASLLSVRFDKAGEYAISLHQIFEDSAYAEDEDSKRDIELDTMYRVSVLPLIDIVSFKANILENGVLGQEISLQDSAEIALVDGTTVRYTFETEGKVNSIVDSDFDGGLLVEESTNVGNGTFDIVYNGLDKVFDLEAILARTNPRSSDTVKYVDFIKLIESQEPLTLVNVIEREGRAYLKFSRSIKSSSIDKDDFEVKITPEGGSEMTATISTAALDTDPSTIVLTLDGDQIYSDDEAVVSYTVGSLEADAKNSSFPAEAFSDESIEHEEINILVAQDYDYGFENTSSVSWGNLPAAGGYLPNVADHTTTVVTDASVAHSGSSYLKMAVNPAPGLATPPSRAATEPSLSAGGYHTFDADLGIYKVSVYLKTENNGGTRFGSLGFDSNCRLYVAAAATQGNFSVLRGWSSISPENEEWTQYSFVFTADRNSDYRFVPFAVNTGVEQLIIYWDDISMVNWNPRP
ncbi:hypothetical protein [Reichenbachiella versicolor]|uniref:hypothetical protein n=1 Tax=Reichenbachiella versicolor TaxID=1821036 RepID=UPI000D6E4C75|nr:hypothetical protein [Reichenbachiella versicolor]